MAPALILEVDSEISSSVFVSEHYHCPQASLLELQREPDAKKSSCDVHLICDQGYIPLHRLILLGMTHFCPNLPPDRSNILMDALRDNGHGGGDGPGCSETGIVAITLTDVKMVHLKAVVSLIYGVEAVIPAQEKAEMEAVIKMLQLHLLCNELREGVLENVVSGGGEDGKSVRCFWFNDQDRQGGGVEVEPPPIESFPGDSSAPVVPPVVAEPVGGGAEVGPGSEEHADEDEVECLGFEESTPRTKRYRMRSRRQGCDGVVQIKKELDQDSVESDSSDSYSELFDEIAIPPTTREKGTEQEGVDGSGGTGRNPNSPPSSPPTDDEHLGLNCMLCSESFSTEFELEFHLHTSCGRHLKFYLVNRVCHSCSTAMENVNGIAFMAHVRACQDDKSKQGKAGSAEEVVPLASTSTTASLELIRLLTRGDTAGDRRTSAPDEPDEPGIGHTNEVGVESATVEDAEYTIPCVPQTSRKRARASSSGGGCGRESPSNKTFTPLEGPDELKCNFCDTVYFTEAELQSHLYNACAGHLEFDFGNRTCLYCSGYGKFMKVTAFMEHVSRCCAKRRERGGRRSSEVEAVSEMMADDDDEMGGNGGTGMEQVVESGEPPQTDGEEEESVEPQEDTEGAAGARKLERLTDSSEPSYSPPHSEFESRPTVALVPTSRDEVNRGTSAPPPESPSPNQSPSHYNIGQPSISIPLGRGRESSSSPQLAPRYDVVRGHNQVGPHLSTPPTQPMGTNNGVQQPTNRIVKRFLQPQTPNVRPGSIAAPSPFQRAPGSSPSAAQERSSVAARLAISHPHSNNPQHEAPPPQSGGPPNVSTSSPPPPPPSNSVSSTTPPRQPPPGTSTSQPSRAIMQREAGTGTTPVVPPRQGGGGGAMVMRTRNRQSLVCRQCECDDMPSKTRRNLEKH